MFVKCEIEDCENRTHCRGMCQKHYYRWWKHGDPHYHTRMELVSKHPLYRAWAGMTNRCHNPNNESYPIYGARGIYVCDLWRYDFLSFLRDMGERPEGMTLDRIDPNGPYSPDNCRWATATEQRVNQSPEGKERQRRGASAGAKRMWKERRHHPDWQKDAANVR